MTKTGLRDWLNALSRLADIYRKIRPRYLNGFAVLLVTTGAGLASSPWWGPLIYSLLGKADPKIDPPSDVLSYSMVGAGVLLAIAANWKSFK